MISPTSTANIVFREALLVLPSLSLIPASISTKKGSRAFLSDSKALVDFGSRMITSSGLKDTNPCSAFFITEFGDL